MAVLLLILGVGTFAFLWWRRHTTTLTRACRWREDRARGLWHCAYCGAETRPEGSARPRDCLQRDRAG